MFGIRHSKGIFINKFLEIPAFQIARLLNFMRYGDCIEVIAGKPELQPDFSNKSAQIT